MNAESLPPPHESPLLSLRSYFAATREVSFDNYSFGSHVDETVRQLNGSPAFRLLMHIEDEALQAILELPEAILHRVEITGEDETIAEAIKLFSKVSGLIVGCLAADPLGLHTGKDKLALLDDAYTAIVRLQEDYQNSVASLPVAPEALFRFSVGDILEHGVNQAIYAACTLTGEVLKNHYVRAHFLMVAGDRRYLTLQQRRLLRAAWSTTGLLQEERLK